MNHGNVIKKLACKYWLLCRYMFAQSYLKPQRVNVVGSMLRALAASTPPILPPILLNYLGFGFLLVSAASHPPFSRPLLIFDDVVPF